MFGKIFGCKAIDNFVHMTETKVFPATGYIEDQNPTLTSL